MSVSQTVRRFSSTTNSRRSAPSQVSRRDERSRRCQNGTVRMTASRQEERVRPVEDLDGRVGAELRRRQADVDPREAGQPSEAHHDHQGDAERQPDAPDAIVHPAGRREGGEVQGARDEGEEQPELGHGLLRAELGGPTGKRQQQHDTRQQRPALPPREARQSQQPKYRGGQHEGERDVVHLHPDATWQDHRGHPGDERRAHQRGAEEERSADLGPSDQHLDQRHAERGDDHEHQPEEQQLDHGRGSGWPRTSGARRRRRLLTPPSAPAADSRRRSSRRIAGSGQKRMHNKSATAPAATSAANVTRVGVVDATACRTAAIATATPALAKSRARTRSTPRPW